jgi:hypothetical protein
MVELELEPEPEPELGLELEPGVEVALGLDPVPAELGLLPEPPVFEEEPEVAAMKGLESEASDAWLRSKVN